MVAVLSVDAYPFLSFSDLTCHVGDTGKEFPGCTVLPDGKETKLASSNLEASPSEGKNIRIILVPCGACKCVPTAISGGANISEILRCYLL